MQQRRLEMRRECRRDGVSHIYFGPNSHTYMSQNVAASLTKWLIFIYNKLSSIKVRHACSSNYFFNSSKLDYEEHLKLDNILAHVFERTNKTEEYLSLSRDDFSPERLRKKEAQETLKFYQFISSELRTEGIQVAEMTTTGVLIWN